jgi:drug/metabolite transporter (DMT)-like permease
MERVAMYILVSLLWGCTNPLLKRAQADPDIRDATFVQKLVKPKIFLPIAINQLGSVVFYYLLATEPLSFAVLIANSLTIVVTCITGWFMGEEIHSVSNFAAGSAFILTGIYLCIS